MRRLTTSEKKSIASQYGKDGVTFGTLAKEFGISRTHVQRIVKLERIRDRVRTADEFKAQPMLAPRRDLPTLSWAVNTIREARDAQLRGDFKKPVALAKMMRTDDALFVAHHNRIAPQAAIATELVSAGGTRGDAVCKKAAVSCITPRSVLQSIVGTMADHGIAIGYIKQETNREGTRTDFELTEWPLEHVRWNPSTEQLETRQREGGAFEPIVHGDGRWIVFRKFAVEPWTREACVLPGALIWASHAEALKSWNAASKAHGRSQVIGEMPEGVALQDEAGNLTPEAKAFLALLQEIVSGEAGAGIRPHGTETDFISNGSTAWQVFLELITNREKAAARIYLGTDAILGSVGGAPGVDIAQLFGVASTKIQGDFEALEQGLFTGLFQPWAAVNEGDSRYAPRLRYLMPDTDAQKETDNFDARLEKLNKRIGELKTNGMTVDQPLINRLCKVYGIDPPLQLAPTAGAKPAITLAPTDFAAVLRVDEARAAGGIPPLADATQGRMFLPQFKAFLEKSGEGAGENATQQPGTGAPPTRAPAPQPEPAPAAPAAP